MYFRYSSYCSFMEVSNSEVFLSQEKDLSSMEFDFLARPALHDDDHQRQDDMSSSHISDDKKSTVIQQQDLENKEDDECKFLVSSTLKSSQEFNNSHVQEAQESSQEFKNIHVQEAQESSQEFKNIHVQEAQEEVDDGFKTPTSLENKIPAVLRCPPAPKKPKSLPLSKRKCPARRRVLLDLSNEIESMFHPDVLKDLISGKIKKVKKESDRIL